MELLFDNIKTNQKQSFSESIHFDNPKLEIFDSPETFKKKHITRIHFKHQFYIFDILKKNGLKKNRQNQT